MKLAIVGIFYDGYEDLWYDFINLFKKNWQDCPYPLYIVNNSKELNPEKANIEGIEVLHAGDDAEYSRKVQLATTQIDADRYLFLLEDFFIYKRIDNAKIEEILDYVQNEEIEYYTLPMLEFVDKKEKEKASPFNDVYKIGKEKEYLFSCQPSIWKREFIANLIGKENYNAWIFEGIYARCDKLRNEEFLSKSLVDYRNVLNLKHGAVQGKMLPKTVKVLKKNGYLLTSPRGKLSKKQLFVRFVKGIVRKVFTVLPAPKFVKARTQSVFAKYGEEIDRLKDVIVTDEMIASCLSLRGNK